MHCAVKKLGRTPKIRPNSFQCNVTLILTLDRAIWHSVGHHSLTSTYIPNAIRIGATVCEWTDGQTLRPALVGRLGGVYVKINYFSKYF